MHVGIDKPREDCCTMHVNHFCVGRYCNLVCSTDRDDLLPTDHDSPIVKGSCTRSVNDEPVHQRITSTCNLSGNPLVVQCGRIETVTLQEDSRKGEQGK